MMIQYFKINTSSRATFIPTLRPAPFNRLGGEEGVVGGGGEAGGTK